MTEPRSGESSLEVAARDGSTRSTNHRSGEFSGSILLLDALEKKRGTIRRQAPLHAYPHGASGVKGTNLLKNIREDIHNLDHDHKTTPNRLIPGTDPWRHLSRSPPASPGFPADEYDRIDSQLLTFVALPKHIQDIGRTKVVCIESLNHNHPTFSILRPGRLRS